MAAKRLNVLVYAGNGSTIESVKHCVYSLRRLLSPHYVVLSVTGEAIIKEPWSASCAMLVMPGGADLGYCRTLNGEGNRRIAQFIERGGSYLGFCAGAYYGSARCEFEVGNKAMEVIGPRELSFFPDTCRGCAFPGFVYNSEMGARAAELKVDKTVLTEGVVPDILHSYYNGGGVFVDAPKYKQKGVQIIASFTEKLNVKSGEGAAAVVYCKVGEGAAILSCAHPEFSPINLDPKATPEMPKIIEALNRDDAHRTNFLRACLSKLGLNVNEEQNVVPSLSRLHLSSMKPATPEGIMASLKEIITERHGEEYIVDENDTFHLEKQSAWSLSSLKSSITGTETEETGQPANAEDRIIDYNEIVKRLLIHESNIPSSKETPYFNHDAYFANVKYYQSTEAGINKAYGQHLLYGEVVTSTNTILEKNTQLLRRLPSGFLATATVQVAGRGRGNNVWVSPAGSLIFSLVVRHEQSLMARAPVVFLQYLAALAIVEGIQSYDKVNSKTYKDLPVKLKWPNDIYALDPSRPPHENAYVKIGGILVNSHYSSSEYMSVIGIGLNTANALPTTSLSALLKGKATAFTLEKLLARIVTKFSALYSRFRDTGFDSYFQDMYYRHWLHSNQIVTLETDEGTRARIKGITEWGLLRAEELGWEDRPTGRTVELQSDSNSFDFFKGLLKRKV